jgi:hypothetical protein
VIGSCIIIIIYYYLRMHACRALFQNKTTRGQEKKSEGASSLAWTAHEGTVSGLRLHSPGTLSTSGLDGRVVLWDLPQLHLSMAALGI